VDSGTKLNIDFYIDDYVDEEHQEIIWDYFMTSESHLVQDAINELANEECTEEEIRIMRIKFLSDKGM
jgi:ATP-dependent DNA helicase RecQ